MTERALDPERDSIPSPLVKEIVDSAQLVIPEGGVLDKLRLAEAEQRPLRVKMGFDPTSPDLHLGHAVGIRQLKRFQELGHIPVIIIGDFTGLIGDPSGRNKSRPNVSQDEIEENARTYVEQLGKVLDVSKVEIHRNSEWLPNMSLTDVIGLLAVGTLSQIISREDFRRRLDTASPIALPEVIYPYLQATDSVMVQADVEVGGIDQLYAFQAARSVQSNRGQQPQASVLMPLLRGIDGVSKMSKSLGNHIGLQFSARDMFAKTMSIPDHLIEEYLRLASFLPEEDIEKMLRELNEGANPIDVKESLALSITGTYHGGEKAQEAKEYFDNQFRSREQRQYDVVEVDLSIERSLPDLLISIGATASKNEARRLAKQGAITLNGQKIYDIDLTPIQPGDRVKVGKHKFYEFKNPTVTSE